MVAPGRLAATLETLRDTLRKKLLALGTLTTQLERDLKERLHRLAAPGIVRTEPRPPGIAQTGHLLREFTRLNAALQDLDKAATRALAPHEREASLRSARLLHRLDGEDRADALRRIFAPGAHALRRPGHGETPEARFASATAPLVVYRLSPTSCDFNARPGDIGFVLAPAHDPTFLQQHPFAFRNQVKEAQHLDTLPTFGNSYGDNASILEAGWTSVAIEAIDRVAGLIVLRADSNSNCLPDLEATGLVDFSGETMLDPTDMDALTKKVTFTLQGIGRPALATDYAATNRALGLGPEPSNDQPDPVRPAARFLWDGAALASDAVARDLAGARATLEGLGVSLNPSQWEAWTGALSRRLSLIWGPPGTGKSQTLHALVGGALVAAHREGRPLRVLVAANNYDAMDSVLERLPAPSGPGCPRPR